MSYVSSDFSLKLVIKSLLLNLLISFFRRLVHSSGFPSIVCVFLPSQDFVLSDWSQVSSVLSIPARHVLSVIPVGDEGAVHAFYGFEINLLLISFDNVFQTVSESVPKLIGDKKISHLVFVRVVSDIQKDDFLSSIHDCVVSCDVILLRHAYQDKVEESSLSSCHANFDGAF